LENLTSDYCGNIGGAVAQVLLEREFTHANTLDGLVSLDLVGTAEVG